MKFPPSPRFRALVCAAAGLLAASCATLPPGERGQADALAARVDTALARRGLGPDALYVIDNIVRDTQAPPAAPPMVRELLARPLAAADADVIFYRAVPGALRSFVDEMSVPSPGPALPGGTQASLRDLLDVYLDELAGAQRVLRSAAHGATIDAQAIIRELASGLPSPERLRAVAAGVDQAALGRATNAFLNATARFVRALRLAGPALEFPGKALRFDSAVGVVVIGTRGDDVHGPDAAVIVDPGGNDTYERAPVTGGAISVIVDLGGDDRYRGSDLVVHGLSAIVDFSGNDRYAMSGPGLGAAIAGVSLIVDFEGDDVYDAQVFGEGAAAFGLGALIDFRGNDTYRLHAGGQGFGMAGGVGLLWDRGGNDTYTATGLTDDFNRGGGISFAQGAAHGFRTMLGGGIGILRDDAGDDSYEAQMFAQGTGYYYSVGLLWDRGGNDRYHAVRYAQGNGVHEAIGVLRDESGDDRYELNVGVGQGMGLDLAVGLLYDGSGDDRYQAPTIVQGTATANGVGIAIDAGGADRWRVDDDQYAWGRAQPLRGLPTVGLLLYDPAQAMFERKGEALPPFARGAELGGPLGDAPAAKESAGKSHCPAGARTSPATLPLEEALHALEAGFTGDGSVDPAIYAQVEQQLRTRLEASIAELPDDDFDVLYSFGEALHCTLIGASAEDAASMWDAMERMLAKQPATPFAGVFAGVLHGRPAPAPQMQRILRVLDANPRCGVRTGALSLRFAAAADDASRASVAPLAQAALRSSCWRLQAEALRVLKRLGVAPEKGVVLPSFLRTGPD